MAAPKRGARCSYTNRLKTILSTAFPVPDSVRDSAEGEDDRLQPARDRRAAGSEDRLRASQRALPAASSRRTLASGPFPDGQEPESCPYPISRVISWASVQDRGMPRKTACTPRSPPARADLLEPRAATGSVCSPTSGGS